jgi:hypothetical protein
VELIDLDEVGQLMWWRYRRERGPGAGCRRPWFYMETTRRVYQQLPSVVPSGPAPGSQEALLRLFMPKEWPR